jgi:hypothetical protein
MWITVHVHSGAESREQWNHILLQSHLFLLNLSLQHKNYRSHELKKVIHRLTRQHHFMVSTEHRSYHANKQGLHHGKLDISGRYITAGTWELIGKKKKRGLSLLNNNLNDIH